MQEVHVVPQLRAQLHVLQFAASHQPPLRPPRSSDGGQYRAAPAPFKKMHKQSDFMQPVDHLPSYSPLLLGAGSAANAMHPAGCQPIASLLQAARTISFVPACPSYFQARAGKAATMRFIVFLFRLSLSRAFRVVVSHQPSRIPCAFSAWPST
jgi:hypothetical protein